VSTLFLNSRCRHGLGSIRLAPCRLFTGSSTNDPTLLLPVGYAVSTLLRVTVGIRAIDTTRPWRQRETLTSMPCMPSCAAMRRSSMASHAGDFGQRAESAFSSYLAAGGLVSRRGGPSPGGVEAPQRAPDLPRLATAMSLDRRASFRGSTRHFAREFLHLSNIRHATPVSCTLPRSGSADVQSS
jgi:hypothetical protein